MHWTRSYYIMIEKAHHNKIIVVAYPVGRIGSSAMMGLLRLSGISVGNQARMSMAAPMNPKGFYELKSQQRFLSLQYPGIYPDITEPPLFHVVDAIGEQGYQEYDGLLEAEFENKFPIAIKSPRFLTLPFLSRLSSKYDVKVLIMSRNEQDMVRSIKRVWERSENHIQKNATNQFILKWIQTWMQFGNEVRKHYPFEYFDVNFDDLLNNQVDTMKFIASFLEIGCPSAQEIHKWLDVSLVNRLALQ
jgi:hypothetical protein